MRKFVPKLKSFSQRVPVADIAKAMGSVVDNVKISSFSGAQRSRFKKQFVSDCMNKNIGNVRGDDMINKKSLATVLKKAVERGILPDKWIADRYKGLLTKGGITLSKVETKPVAPGSVVMQKTSKPDMKAPGAVQTPVKTGRKFTTVEEVQKFRANLTEKIAARKAQSNVQGPQEKEDNGEVKTARYQTETTQGTGGKNAVFDKNNTELKSGGKKRVEKPGSKGPAKGTGGQKTGGMALTSRGLPKSMTARPVRGMEISNDELSRYRGLGLGRGLNSNGNKEPDIAGGADDLARENDWRFAAYSQNEKDTTTGKSDLKESKQLGGQENDSFGADDWKNN